MSYNIDQLARNSLSLFFWKYLYFAFILKDVFFDIEFLVNSLYFSFSTLNMSSHFWPSPFQMRRQLLIVSVLPFMQQDIFLLLLQDFLFDFQEFVLMCCGVDLLYLSYLGFFEIIIHENNVFHQIQEVISNYLFQIVFLSFSPLSPSVWDLHYTYVGMLYVALQVSESIFFVLQFFKLFCVLQVR